MSFVLRIRHKSGCCAGDGGTNLQKENKGTEENDTLVKVQSQHTDDDLSFEEEWRIVAMTMDRIMLIGFSIVFIVGTLGIFAHTRYVV